MIATVVFLFRRIRSGSKCTDENRNLNEGSTQNSTSKTFVNLSGATNPSKSVDLDFRGMPEINDEFLKMQWRLHFLEDTIEKSSKNSWYTSSIRASFDSDAELCV